MNRTLLPWLVCAGLAASANHAAEPQALETEDQKTLYAVGLALSQRLTMFKLSEADIQLVQAGLVDGALSREPKVALETYGPKIDGMLRTRLALAAEVEKTAGKAFLEEAAKNPGAVKLPSGLIYKEVEPGAGASPQSSDTVKIHYKGTLRDGKVFDSSLEAGEPVSFAIANVVPCFSEGIQKMKVGGRSQLTCPPELAYGDQGSPPAIPAGATLVFDVQLLDIEKPAAPAPAPAPSAP